MNMESASVAGVKEWPFYKTCILMVLFAPVAAGIAARLTPLHLQVSVAYPIAMFVASSLLSVLGMALSPSSRWKVVASSALIVVGALFVLWLFTSSIGGWAPNPLGVFLSCVGGCAGFLLSSMPLLQSRVTAAITIWIVLGIVSLFSSALGLAAVNRKMSETQAGTSAFLEKQVLPTLLVDPGTVKWTSQGKAPKGSTEEYQADGEFIQRKGRVHADVTSVNVAYVISLYTKTDFEQGSHSDVGARLINAKAWLAQEGVMTLALRDLNVYSNRWMAETNYGTVYIEPFKGGVTISGYTQLPHDVNRQW